MSACANHATITLAHTSLTSRRASRCFCFASVRMTWLASHLRAALNMGITVWIFRVPVPGHPGPSWEGLEWHLWPPDLPCFWSVSLGWGCLETHAAWGSGWVSCKFSPKLSSLLVLLPSILLKTTQVLFSLKHNQIMELPIDLNLQGFPPHPE